MSTGPKTSGPELEPVSAPAQPYHDYPDETRSVVSISNHMERLGHEVSEIPQSRDDPVAGAVIEQNNSLNETANQSGTSADSQGTAFTAKGSSLDARIASLSEMGDAERCAELAQPVQVEQVQDIPMDTEFNYDTEEELGGDDTNTTAGPASDMPDLEGSDGDL